jgi:hypothetical protein
MTNILDRSYCMKTARHRYARIRFACCEVLQGRSKTLSGAGWLVLCVPRRSDGSTKMLRLPPRVNIGADCLAQLRFLMKKRLNGTIIGGTWLLV